MSTKKLQWETPQIYPLDSHRIKSGDDYIGNIKNQKGLTIKKGQAKRRFPNT